jgi:CRP-like cAMP-binding protein
MLANCFLKIYEKGEMIYKQGVPSPFVYFVLRGSVEVSVVKNDLGNLPVVIKILYDG